MIDLLNSKIAPIVSSPEYRALVEKSGSVAVASTPQAFQTLINDTASEAAPIVKEFGLELE